MSRKQPKGGFDPVKAIRKFFVSAFVILTFVAYAVHEHFASPDTANGAIASQGSTTTQQAPTSPATDAPAAPPTDVPVAPQTDSQSTAATLPKVTALPPASPTSVPPPTAKPNGQYKDGTFTGTEVDAYWGLVRVKAVIRSGKIAEVQFLEYPSDRRTSQRINNVAMPYLKTEAIQVQNANVDIISGATLTSEAFAQSLQAALDSAKN
jgi:uncharacterized protein with FMN-binding domain